MTTSVAQRPVKRRAASSQAVRAMVQTGPRKLELQEFPRPKIGPDQAILKVEACGICGSDIEQYTGKVKAVAYPFIPGHEPLGIIDEIGEHAAKKWGVKVGDRVAVESLLTCGVCEHCLSGSRNTCGHQVIYGFTPTTTAPALWGAYADYLFLHADTIVHRMSNELPASVAALYNPMGAGVRWAVNTPSMRTGDTVVVLGAGQRGLACVIAAKAAGAGKIIVTDISAAAHKLDLALELGAHCAIVADEDSVLEGVSHFTGGRMADIVVDVCGATQALVDAVDLVRWGGTIVLAGLKGDGVGTTLLTDKMVMRTIALRGVFTVDPTSYRQAIQLIESGVAPFGKLRSGSYELKDAEAAIHRLAGWDGKPPGVHVVIEPQHPR